MKAVIQRSLKAQVEVQGKIVGEIKNGLVILLGISTDDTEGDIAPLINKIVNLRLFEQGDKFFEKSIKESEKEILLISQFTLYASCKNGRRPDFIKAAKAEQAEPLYKMFIKKLKEEEIKVETGVFGEMMNISLTNNGPVTIILDSKELTNKQN